MDRHLRFPRHRGLLAGAALAVVAAHLGVGQWLGRSAIGTGWVSRPPAPIEVAFVRPLAPAAPPAPRPPAPRPLPTRVPTAPDLTLPPLEPLAQAPPSHAPAPVEPEPEPAPPWPPEATALPPDGTAFDWPAATRLQYVLTGQYRGPLHGSGQVDWLRQDSHYQVRVTIEVEPAFTRRQVSDGEITPQGLAPRRYDEETDVPLRPLRNHTLHFDAQQVQLSGGLTAPAPPGVQDSASQFVQLTWLFLNDPDRLAVGASVTLPLALPRRVGRWTYDVVDQGPLALPFGTVAAYHLVPRPGSAGPGEFTAEIWVAPSLQYLPVRLIVRQDAETWLDLQLKDPPLQAAPAVPASGTLPALRPVAPPQAEVSR